MIRMMRLIATVGLLCLAIGSLASPGLADPRIALVVGTGNYQHAQSLPNPPRDARAIDAKLRSLGFQTDLLIDPDRAALEQAIRRFGDRARGADAALFYYAGHAFEAGGENYIVPASANLHSIRDVPFETLPVDLISEQAGGRARVVLIFLDACRDNPFLPHITGDERGLMSRGLAPPSGTATGTLIAYATSPKRIAEDGGNEHSPFTAALLRWLDAPGLEIRQMLSRVRLDVREATRGQQIPWESSSLEGDFYFRPAAQPAAPAQSPLPPPSAQAADTQSGVPGAVQTSPPAEAPEPLPLPPEPPAEPPRPPPSPRPPSPPRIAMASRPTAKPPLAHPTESNPVIPGPATPGTPPVTPRVTSPVAPQITPPITPPGAATTTSPQASPSPPVAAQPPMQPTPPQSPAVAELPAIPLKPYCKVPNFYGARTVAGSYAEMQVINIGLPCSGHFNRAGRRDFPYFNAFVVSQPSHGTLDVVGGRFAYTPERGFTGRDKFEVGTSAPYERATFGVTVLPPTAELK